jgi:hypothetical protein
VRTGGLTCETEDAPEAMVWRNFTLSNRSDLIVRCANAVVEHNHQKQHSLLARWEEQKLYCKNKNIRVPSFIFSGAPFISQSRTSWVGWAAIDPI